MTASSLLRKLYHCASSSGSRVAGLFHAAGIFGPPPSSHHPTTVHKQPLLHVPPPPIPTPAFVIGPRHPCIACTILHGACSTGAVQPACHACRIHGGARLTALTTPLTARQT